MPTAKTRQPRGVSCVPGYDVPEPSSGLQLMVLEVNSGIPRSISVRWCGGWWRRASNPEHRGGIAAEIGSPFLLAALSFYMCSRPNRSASAITLGVLLHQRRAGAVATTPQPAFPLALIIGLKASGGRTRLGPTGARARLRQVAARCEGLLEQIQSFVRQDAEISDAFSSPTLRASCPIHFNEPQYLSPRLSLPPDSPAIRWGSAHGQWGRKN
jgi:hypothetical protein